MIKIVRNQTIDAETLDVPFNGQIHVIQIEIDDITGRAKEMINDILDTSWIQKLNPINRISYNASAKRTIDKLVNKIFQKIDDEMTEEFGEYVISMSAQDTLAETHGHTKIPLAELFKEKVSGNPGFDFHTESTGAIICFGEAKYSSQTSPYSDALVQIASFIDLEKDTIELANLQNFVTSQASHNAVNGKRAYIAAFSINAKLSSTIFKNALKPKFLSPLSNCQELYLIGAVIK